MEEELIEAVALAAAQKAIAEGETDPVELRKRVEEALFLFQREVEYRIAGIKAHDAVREMNTPTSIE